MEQPIPLIKSIWLADDDPEDRELFKDVISQVLPKVNLTLIPNGDVLMETLGSGAAPDLLFLDINMPCKDGMDCLLEIRGNRSFARLPIIIFSSQQSVASVDKAYGYGANLYYNKPSTFKELIEGLSDLFQMNWNDPCTITSNHYINRKFVPYNKNIRMPL